MRSCTLHMFLSTNLWDPRLPRAVSPRSRIHRREPWISPPSPLFLLVLSYYPANDHYLRHREIMKLLEKGTAVAGHVGPRSRAFLSVPADVNDAVFIETDLARGGFARRANACSSRTTMQVI